MSNRFTDSKKFQDKWYRKLTCKQKCIWEYMLSECSNAGFLSYDLEVISFYIGEEVTEADMEIFKDRLQFISEDFIFIPKFVLFQQKINSFSELNEKNNAHKSILNELRKYNIDLTSPSEPPPEVLTRAPGIGRGKGNGIGKGNKEEEIKSIKPEFLTFGEYGNVYLTQMQRNEVDCMTMDKKAAIDLIDDLSLNIVRNKAPVFDPKNPDIHIAELKAYWNYRKKNRSGTVTSINSKKSASELVNEVLQSG